jgi:hypothetical protein
LGFQDYNLLRNQGRQGSKEESSMRRFQSILFFLLALLISVVPAIPAHAGVFISVGIAPPALPVYVQPPCPEPNLMWTPGYWAYDYDQGQYYWVPGAWVPAPYEGALWTPPYWGFDNGFYAFHAGYWGPVVGYYGGVNYGFGYMGVGFAGGEWHEHHFFYNTAIINVNRTYIHNTYVNETIVRDHTIVNNNHIAYAGGPHGIQHMPTPEERHAMEMPHARPTSFQQQHMEQARSDRQNFFNANHGNPRMVAVARPLPAEHVQAPSPVDVHRGLPGSGGLQGRSPETVNRPMQPAQPVNRPLNTMQPNQRQNENSRITAAPVNQQPQHGFGGMQQAPPQPERTVQPQRMPNQYPQNGRPEAAAPQQHPAPQVQSRPEPQLQYRPQAQPQQQYRPQAQPQYRPQPQPQQHPQAQPERMPESRPAPQPHNEGRPHR